MNTEQKIIAITNTVGIMNRTVKANFGDRAIISLHQGEIRTLCSNLLGDYGQEAEKLYQLLPPLVDAVIASPSCAVEELKQLANRAGIHAETELKTTTDKPREAFLSSVLAKAAILQVASCIREQAIGNHTNRYRPVGLNMVIQIQMKAIENDPSAIETLAQYNTASEAQYTAGLLV